jgi:hypothetical protein
VPKRLPSAAPPGVLPATTAPTPHLSSTILLMASRSTTKEGDLKKKYNYLWLFRMRMSVVARIY